MAHYLDLAPEHLGKDPLILIVPGMKHDDDAHWQARWERERGDCQRVELGMWDNPHRNTWVNQLNLAVHKADRPVILVAEGMGCLAVAWWADFERPSQANPVVGAVFLNPPDVDRPGTDPRLASFGSCPRRTLPFPSFLVAPDSHSHDQLRTTRMLAIDWDARFMFAETTGESDDRSESGTWAQGAELVSLLAREHRRAQGNEWPAPATPADEPRRSRLPAFVRRFATAAFPALPSSRSPLAVAAKPPAQPARIG